MMNNRWIVFENGIKSIDFNNHHDDIEMSGELVSGIVSYSNYDSLKIEIELIYPMLRIHPNKTRDSYKFKVSTLIDTNEKLIDIIIDGVLTITTCKESTKIIRRFYPSVTLSCFYEEIEVIGNEMTDINDDSILDEVDGIGGTIFLKRVIENYKSYKKICYYASYNKSEFINEIDSLLNRKNRIDQICNCCILKTDNEILNTMFRFAKIRACESIFKTKNGYIHSPGGGNYYAAIWCNDELEYTNPFLGFIDDDITDLAAINHIDWYLPYMKDDFNPIPSSIISEGVDYWNGAGDRGDASMYLFGASRYFLTKGIIPTLKHQNALKWCAQYIISKKNEFGIIESDSDELENRISSGKMNLNTNSLSYEALRLYSVLLDRIGKLSEAREYKKISSLLQKDIIKYFSANIDGYQTFKYHDDCDEIRAWNTMALYTKFNDNVTGTVDSIEDHLWDNGSLRSTIGEEILWDRSALYYITSLFKNGFTYLGYTRLLEYSKKRLLSNRVPYPVEAYPEYNMRHLSGESSLYARIFTDGILEIDFTKDGFTMRPKMGPLKYFKLENIYICGKIYDIEISKEKIKINSNGLINEFKLGELIIINSF